MQSLPLEVARTAHEAASRLFNTFSSANQYLIASQKHRFTSVNQETSEVIIHHFLTKYFALVFLSHLS